MNTPDQMIDRSMLCFFEQERLSCQIVSIVPLVGTVWSLEMTPQPEIARPAIIAPARLKSPTQQVISTYFTGRQMILANGLIYAYTILLTCTYTTSKQLGI